MMTLVLFKRLLFTDGDGKLVVFVSAPRVCTRQELES